MRCPYCRKELTLSEIQCDEEWREILGLVPVFGKHSRLVFEYVEKFGVAPLKLKSKKLLRLLAEVGALFAQKKFTLKKAEYAISLDGIVQGLTVVNNKHFENPLENHNYLRKVLATIADAEKQGARDQADKGQKEREVSHREHREHREDEKILSPGENAERIRALLAGIGG